MYLTEVKIIKDKAFYKEIDAYCSQCSSLYNITNYNINQIYRIATKMNDGLELKEWEQAFIDTVNEGIDLYNHRGRVEKHLPHIDKDHRTMADFYFINWYMRGSTDFYDTLPLIMSGQRVIEELCKAWVSYFKLYKSYKAGNLRNKPQRPGYKDKKTGRVALVIDKQNFKEQPNKIILSKRLNNYTIKTNKSNIQQVRLITEHGYIKAKIIYKVDDIELQPDNQRYYSIDLGVNNLMTIVSNVKGINPYIVNGKPLKAINQYYYKHYCNTRKICRKINNVETTKTLVALSDKRNRKVEDYLHKVSRMVIKKAKSENISKIVVGKNIHWKEKCKMGKRGNQNFESIPYNKLLKMLEYKGRLEGIEVILVEESYTSGTSYIDGEMPIRENYNKSRRVHRGLFKTSKGIYINADVNGAYQILKKTELLGKLKYKGQEQVDKIRTAS